MSAVIVDLPRVRRALSALDAIAQQQGLRPGAGHFTEEDVRAMLGKSVNERQKTFRDQQAGGWLGHAWDQPVAGRPGGSGGDPGQRRCDGG